MKKTMLLAGALTALIVLTGCTPAASTSSAPATRQPAPATPTATSTSTPTVTPIAAQPAQPLKITFDGLGPYSLGQDGSDLLTANGFTSQTAGCLTTYTWKSGDPQQTGKQEYSITVGMKNGSELYESADALSPDGHYVNDPRAPRTDVGVQLGDTWDKVMDWYHGLTKTADNGDSHEYMYGPVGGHYLLITTTTATRPYEVVTGLRAASYPGGAIPGC